MRNFSLMLVILSISRDGAESFSVATYRIPTRPGFLVRLSNQSRSTTLPGTSKKSAKSNKAEVRRQLSSSSGDPGDSHRRLEECLSIFVLLTPIWTVLASLFAIWQASWCSKVVGSLPVMQKAYASLMFVMGLTISPMDLKRTLRYPSILFTNALLCFGMMPLLACGIARGFSYTPSQAVGLFLLGSVSGGQASNLFTLIADGDVALSVICTISTTLLGVFATPFLVQLFLGCSVNVDGLGVLQSIASLVLLPLSTGSALARFFPKLIRGVSLFLPVIGVLSTLVLVGGGSSNSIVSASTIVANGAKPQNWASCVIPSCVLSSIGGFIAFCISKSIGLNERTKRSLVIETMSKSPTLAYILALRHFDLAVASVPGAAMVTLAVLGALVASIWSFISRSVTLVEQ